MSSEQTTSVDVQDMTCAQALAVVARAVAQLTKGQRLGILYNAQDVKHDLMVWAQDRGACLTEDGPGRLRWQRCRTRSLSACWS